MRAGGLLPALRLALRVQVRAGFPQVYLGVALVLAAALRWVVPEWRELLLPALLLGEPGTLGIFLVAAHRFYDRNQRADAALLVTPIGDAAFIAAPVLATTLWGTAAGLAIQALVLGVDARLVALAAPLALTVAFSGLVGWLVAGLFGEFTRFLLGSVPATLVLLLPIVGLVAGLPPEALVWLPSQWALVAFAETASAAPDPALVLACCAGLAAGCALGMTAAERIFRERVRAAAEVS